MHTKTLIFTDFDGTLTECSGASAVSLKFYQSLLQGSSKRAKDYQNTAFIDDPLAKFQEKFGNPFNKESYTKPNANLLITSQALDFLKIMLSTKNVEIVIVTKNREEYIKFLLQYQGISEEEISKLTIMSIISLKMEKNAAVTKHFLDKNYTEENKPEFVYVLDDAEKDFNLMRQGVINQHYPKNNIKAYNKPPGQFDWIEYKNEILGRMDVPIQLVSTFSSLWTASQKAEKKFLYKVTQALCDKKISKDNVNDKLIPLMEAVTEFIQNPNGDPNAYQDALSACIGLDRNSWQLSGLTLLSLLAVGFVLFSIAVGIATFGAIPGFSMLSLGGNLMLAYCLIKAAIIFGTILACIAGSLAHQASKGDIVLAAEEVLATKYVCS